jgi:hypothetical protein
MLQITFTYLVELHALPGCKAKAAVTNILSKPVQLKVLRSRERPGGDSDPHHRSELDRVSRFALVAIGLLIDAMELQDLHGLLGEVRTFELQLFDDLATKVAALML